MNKINLFESGKEIAIVSLTYWLDCACGAKDTPFVALPMIQRGSVWRPEQIIDLWDSLLRGMPVGSLMVNELSVGTKVRPIGREEMVTLERDGIGLLDGQQRTLAMLLGWTMPPGAQRMDRRVWVDFADTPGNEQLYRLRVTTKNQPFGFRRDAPSSKLSLEERRKAREAYFRQHNQDLGTGKVVEINLDDAKPYSHGDSLSIDLYQLIQLWRKPGQTKETWVDEVLAQLEVIEKWRRKGKSDPVEWERFCVWEELDNERKAAVSRQVQMFSGSLERLFHMQLPLIKIGAHLLEHDDDTIEPPLAVLFKRVGTGGTALSNEDYIYSVIKHRVPETFTLVEELHRKQLHGSHSIASLLTATDLVVTAVRLAAAHYPKSEGRFSDSESLNKEQFHTLLKAKMEGGQDFLTGAFFPMIRAPADTETVMAWVFSQVHELLQYRGGRDPGLPAHALPLLRRPLVQVLLRWAHLAYPQRRAQVNPLLESRTEVLRFVMFWLICVDDERKASKRAFELLGGEFKEFPGKALYHHMLDAKAPVAIHLVAPSDIQDREEKLSASSPQNLLRGWGRWIEQKDEKTRARMLYKRWWSRNGSHIHPILLWLQREVVSGFEGEAVAGREEDTPYDYDHICPSNHWGSWSGVPRETAACILNFNNDKNDGHGHSMIGNSIGNVRVWDSSMNRSDGAASPRKKLELDSHDSATRLLVMSAIHSEQIEDWKNCSGDDGAAKIWTLERAMALQNAVEHRAFDLYTRYFNELGFSDWLREDT